MLRMIMGVVEVIGAVAEAKPSAWVQSRSPSNTATLTPAFGKALENSSSTAVRNAARSASSNWAKAVDASKVGAGASVVVGAAVVVGEAESDPLPHAEVTNRNVRAIACFLTVGSCHPLHGVGRHRNPHGRCPNDWLQAPTEAILSLCIQWGRLRTFMWIVPRAPAQPTPTKSES